MLSALTVLLVIAGVVLIPYSIALGALSFVGAFVTAGAAYKSRHDMEMFLGWCLILGTISGIAAWIGKLW